MKPRIQNLRRRTAASDKCDTKHPSKHASRRAGRKWQTGNNNTLHIYTTKGHPSDPQTCERTRMTHSHPGTQTDRKSSTPPTYECAGHAADRLAVWAHDLQRLVVRQFQQEQVTPPGGNPQAGPRLHHESLDTSPGRHLRVALRGPPTGAVSVQGGYGGLALA